MQRGNQVSNQLGFGGCTPTARQNSSVKMEVDGKATTYGQLNFIDRLSDLPDPILHHIISFLGTEEACRTTILSKRWTHIWPTGLILDFKPQYFVPKIDGDFVSSITGPYHPQTIDGFMNFTESTTRRYSEKNLSIRKFNLEYPIIDKEMDRRIDRWVRIASQNQVEELSLSLIPKIFPSYELPAILFSTNSLRSLKLSKVGLPYIEDTNLISLECLELTRVYVDERMLQDIIVSCPLKTLKIHTCFGIQNISIPSCSRLESFHVVETVHLYETILVDTSSIQRFTYKGSGDQWKFILTPVSKKNLRELRIFNALIEYDIFSNLVSELSSIEDISLFDCSVEDCIRIASETLKKLLIHDCHNLSRVTMDAPELETFSYIGDPQLYVTNNHNKCNAYYQLTVDDLDTRAFAAIKHFLSNSICCKVLSIIVNDDLLMPEITFDEGELSNGHPEPSSDVIAVPELKLSVSWHDQTPEMSTCKALIDGLLWCCRPDVLSINLPSNNSAVKIFLEILQKKVKYWKHPLKRMEIEGTNSSSLSVSWDLEVRLRLYW